MSPGESWNSWMLAFPPAASSTSLWSRLCIYTAIYLFNTDVFMNLSVLCLRVLYHWCQILWEESLWSTTYISSHMTQFKFSLQIGFLLSLPRLPSMVEKEDFEIEGLDFMVCVPASVFILWYDMILMWYFSLFTPRGPVSVRGPSALPQPENQRAGQPPRRLALWH